MLDYCRNKERGFTLVELLISIAIISIILGVVLFNQSTYTERAALSALSDEISLMVSQAQVYSTGVREFSVGSNIFSASYGLTFSLLSSGSPNAYLYFADRNGNEIYDGTWSCQTGGAEECLNRIDIFRGNYIESLCVVRTSGADLCNVGRVDISFNRPILEAHFKFFNNGGNEFNPANMKGVKIQVKSPNDFTKSITIYSSGQISVQ